MYAALKDSTVHAYPFEGDGYECPEWFNKFVVDDCESDGFENLVWELRDQYGRVVNAVTLVQGDSVLLLNDTFGLHFSLISYDEFDEMYFLIGNEWRAALKDDCVEYYCFEDSPHYVPDWVKNHIKIHQPLYNSWSVFVRNRFGDVQALSNSVFTSAYEF